MRPSLSFLSGLTALLSLVQCATALNYIGSNSLAQCMDNSGLSAQLFNVAFTPNNNTLTFRIIGISTITGNVTISIDLTAYGYSVIDKSFNPCDATLFGGSPLTGICPFTTGNIDLDSNFAVPPSVASQIPSIAYGIPDLEGQVEVKIYRYGTETMLACVQVDLTNGKTVYQAGVGWTTAVIAGLALLTSAVISGLGHSNAATHVAANALSLFSYFQGQAFFGMTAIELPPIVAAWTQNFQWSMGIIHIGFIQDIANWYQQATGGSPSTILASLQDNSITVEKRAVQLARPFLARAATTVFKRASGTSTAASQVTVVHGIDRVGFVAGIEPTEIFLTGYIFFIVVMFFVVIGVVATRWILELLARSGKMKNDKFLDFRNGWTTVLRGILFRFVLIGFPQMTVLCFWEFTVKDSAAEIVLAVITIGTMLVMLTWACIKVWMLAKRSIGLHKNPAYILYSDPVCLHKWGFLYVQYKATAYWFIVPVLGFVFVLGLFVGLGQGSGLAQAIAFLILNAGLLVAVSILRPYMDKKTNGFNISIAAVNFTSSIFLLFFTNVFNVPGLVLGIMGVIFALMNAIFALVLLILVLVATGFAIFSKNPDVRYQPMRDDRGSFIKSQSALTTELDALGATARGESKAPVNPREADEDSIAGSDWNSGYHAVGSYESKTPATGGYYRNSAYDSQPTSPYASGLHADSIRSTPSAMSNPPNRSHTASPWQRGAGYDR